MRAKALVFSLFIISGLACGSSAQQVTYKISQTMSMGGMPQPMSTTTYVKGSRKRTENGGMMGMGGDVATIEQCDLKQNVQVNDKKKMYHIEPMDNGSDAAPVRGGTAARSTPVKKGGTVTVVSNITDTGERKQMFGMTARHIKTSMSMEASPDACMKGDMKTETDGWYIDLPEFSCPLPMRPMQYGPGARGGCEDQYVYRSTGGGKMGFPLEQTMTMSGGVSQAIHTIDFSRAPLDQMLFEVPTGYTAVTDSQQLYGQPDMSAMMAAMKNGNTGDDEPNNSNTSRSSGNMGNMGNSPASNFNGIKVAVLMPTNRGDNVPTADLQNYLIGRITGGNVMAFAASSEAEARSMGANYILWSDISKLKQSTAGKIGGMFGRATGAPTSGTYDAQVDFKLVKIGDGSTVLSSKANSKSETDAQRAAEAILGQEATAVLGAAK